MSKLLEKGFKPTDIAKITALVASVVVTDKRNLEAVTKSLTDIRTVYGIWANHMGSNSYSHFMAFMKEHFNMEFATCHWHGESQPMALLVEIPNGANHYARADLVARDGWDWEYTSTGTIIKSGRLYGDTNILGYNTDPLKYLKFRTMSDEKVKYNIANDSCVNDEFSGVAPVFLGIELEVERNSKTPKKIEHMIASDLGMDYMILKSDSSLENGIEIVTAPASIRFHLQAWDKFFDNSAKLLSSWVGGRCGMHVHVNRSAFTPMHLGKLVAFINNPENRDFVTSIAGRNSKYGKYVENKNFHIKTTYVSQIDSLYKELKKATKKEDRVAIEKKIAATRAKAASNSIGSTLHTLQDITHAHREERHSAVNLAKAGTVEIRIFRGNVMKVGMLKNLEFVHAAVEFTREATFRTHPLNAEEIAERKLKNKENTDYALHHTYFLDWLEKNNTGNYNNLKQWLQTAKITDKFAKKKVSSKTPPNKRVTDEDIRACA